MTGDHPRGLVINPEMYPFQKANEPERKWTERCKLPSKSYSSMMCTDYDLDSVVQKRSTDQYKTISGDWVFFHWELILFLSDKFTHKVTPYTLHALGISICILGIFVLERLPHQPIFSTEANAKHSQPQVLNSRLQVWRLNVCVLQDLSTIDP